jgi:glucose/arabinose dehydrogenase
MRRAYAACLIVLSLVPAAVGAASAPAAAATPLIAIGFQFVPPVVAMPAGDTFTFTKVASWSIGTVYAMDILPEGLLGPAIAYATGFSSPLGIAIDVDGRMYVSDSHPSQTPGRSTAGRVWRIPPRGGDAAEVGEIVVDELPNGRHNTNGMAIRDGRLYIANGNSTDDGVTGGDPEMPLSGTLVSVPLDATGVVVGTPTEADLSIEATGMRNLYDVAFRPGTDEAWIPTNGLDMQGPWGEDTLQMARVDDDWVLSETGERVLDENGDPIPKPPPDFGFPGCVYRAGPDGMEVKQNENPAVADVCDDTHVPPEQLLGLHVSADGLAFGPEDSSWGGDLFIAEWGNLPFEAAVTGHKIVRVPIAEDGTSGPPVDFLPGGLPLDLTFYLTDMYVADFGAGVLLVKSLE